MKGRRPHAGHPERAGRGIVRQTGVRAAQVALTEQESRAAEGERQRILAVARDRCPKCAAPLVTITYRNVELDKCSSCEGLWFDSGELDKVLAEEGGFLSGLKRIFG